MIDVDSMNEDAISKRTVSGKQKSEVKHKRVYKFLKNCFSDCVVSYNGLEGIDVYVQYSDNAKVWVEIKTCEKIVCNGIDHKKMQQGSIPEVFNIHRLGRLKFDRRKLSPYTVSQHDDLVDLDGWYLFFVGNVFNKFKILFGIPAKKVMLSDKCGRQQLQWDILAMNSFPDWFEDLKKQVYR